MRLVLLLVAVAVLVRQVQTVLPVELLVEMVLLQPFQALM
jgi:hypothetical protein